MADTIETRNGTLELVRIFDLRLVPKELVEQMPGRYEIIMKLNLGICSDPGNLIYALVTDENKIVGILMLRFNGLLERLEIYFLGLLKEYQGFRKQSIPKQIIEFAQNIQKRLKIEKPIKFASDRPKVMERLGFVRTGLIEMECPITEEK